MRPTSKKILCLRKQQMSHISQKATVSQPVPMFYFGFSEKCCKSPFHFWDRKNSFKYTFVDYMP